MKPIVCDLLTIMYVIYLPDLQNSTILKRWANDIKEQADFISLPDVIEPLPQPGQLNLELAFTNGCVMRLDGDISPAQLTAITQSIATQSAVAQQQRYSLTQLQL